MGEAREPEGVLKGESFSSPEPSVPTAKVHVPEPHARSSVRRRLGERVEPDQAPPGLLSLVGRWVRVFKLESGVFVVTLAILSALAGYLAVDPGPGDSAPLVVVGPEPGQDLGAYLASRKGVLEDVSAEGGERTAVVTFETALTAGRMESLVLPRGVELVEVIVALPEDYPVALAPQPDVATAVSRWVAEREALLSRRKESLSEIVRSSPSPEPAAAWYAKEAQSLDRSLATVRAGEVVVGAIVTGTGRALLELQGDSAVRLVDVAPPGTSPDRIAYRLARN